MKHRQSIDHAGDRKMNSPAEFERRAGTFMLILSAIGLLIPGGLILFVLGLNWLGPVLIVPKTGGIRYDKILPNHWLTGAYLVFLVVLFGTGFTLSRRGRP